MKRELGSSIGKRIKNGEAELKYGDLDTTPTAFYELRQFDFGAGPEYGGLTEKEYQALVEERKTMGVLTAIVLMITISKDVPSIYEFWVPVALRAE